MIKLAIIGYGKMGKLTESLAPNEGFKVVSIIDPIEKKNCVSAETLKDADVCIEFTSPETVVSNIREIAKYKKNIVTGTTGWLDKIDEVKKIVSENNTGFLYGSNFSVGVNLFFSIIQKASEIMSNSSEYDPFGLEIHHNQKADSPSGTAKILSDIVLQNIERKNVNLFDKVDRKIKQNEFHFASIRAGNNPGEHVIGFDSDADSITLKHTARNRNGLALGALKAAKWINGKTGFYNFSDIFEEIVTQSSDFEK